MLRSAVERKFGIIGDALSQLHRFFPQYSTRISRPEQIIAFRNQIIHGYATVRDDIVWEIIQTYLPRLHQEATQLLNEPDASAP
jgi:uncharacterized protein with HEPN domain